LAVKKARNTFALPLKKGGHADSVLFFKNKRL